ncbi:MULTISPECIES: pantoate--beta-alanine ligase [Gracilibacillus]|uniref:pantoate--beta-alanine ligase n=1 Tax=Gracilibacillus TaxID=74385 RepID=UPI000B0FE716|nr:MULTISPECIES: pantoate--beta-alanine ligase [Gracilibacillus]
MTQVIRTVAEIRQVTEQIKARQQTIGFVPTMGYLHEGHTTLIDNAKQDTDFVIASIFVNPLQFGPNEDFDKYPRDEVHDLLLAKQHGVDYLFMPTINEMYPAEPTIRLHVEKRTDVLCGKSRPGHFDGVVTVLSKLFHLTKADFAYFGLKDAQQAAIVDALVTDLNYETTMVGVPTVRETDGLAKSSRNVYLSEQERQEAKEIYLSLQKGRQLMVDGNRNPAMIIEEVKTRIHQKTNGIIDYVEILSYPSLQPLEMVQGQVIIAAAVQFKQARLIDNIIMDERGQIPDVIF